MKLSKIKRFFSGRRGRYLLFASISLLSILLLLVGNILFTHLAKKKNIFTDLSAEGLYTMTDLMEQTMASVDQDITVTFCSDPDVLYANERLRHVYILALEVAKKSDRITVETVNIRKEPERVERFRITGASEILPTDVIFSSGARYAIYGQNAFWSTESDGETVWAFQGEYKMATAILTVAASSLPSAYFSVGHGELYYDPNNADHPDNAYLEEFYRLLLETGMTVGTVDLEKQDVPEDCALLLVIEPKTDFVNDSLHSLYEKPALERLDRYLCGEYGSTMVFLDPEHTLPNLNEFLGEWGLAVGDGTVADTKESLDPAAGGKTLIATYGNANDESAVGHSYYSSIADLVAPPKTILKDVRPLSLTWGEEESYEFHYNYISLCRGVSPFFLSSAGAQVVKGSETVAQGGPFVLAAISTQIYTDNSGNDHFSYVFTAGGSEMISSEFLKNAAYANRDITASVLREISRTDVYAPMELGAANLNNQETYGGNRLQSDAFESTEGLTLGRIVLYTLLVLLPAIAAPIVCVVIRIRRRYL